ncbi:MAG: SIMPL domain-containing protein [Bacillota bacterium]
MKKISIVLLMLVLVTSIFIIDNNDLMSNKVYAQESENIEKSSLEVNGNATIEVKPDVAYINIGVRSEDKNSLKAQENNKEKMNKIIKELKDFGLTDQDMETNYYSINKRYNYLKDNKKETYYVVSNQLKLTITDLDTIGKLIDLSTKAGANDINSIRYDLKNDKKHYNEALKLAMDDAKTKATAILENIDAEVTKPVKIIEHSNNQGIYRDNTADYMAKEATSQSTPIKENNISIKARLKVIYEY